MKSKPTYEELEKENKILRQRMEETLKISEANYQDIFQTITIGISYTNLQGKVLATNKALENILNIPNDEIVGKNIVNLTRKLLTVKTVKTTLPKILSLIAGKDIKPFVIDYQDKIIEIYTNYSKKTKRITGIVRDITGQKKAEQALKDSESYKNALFHRSFAPMVVMDRDTYKFVDCNDAAIKIYGYKSKEEVLGKTPADVSTHKQYNGELSSKAAKGKIEIALKDGFVLFEWLHQRPNKDIWDAEVHLMSIKHKGKVLLQFSLLDITDRKKVECALKNSEEKLRNIFENSSNVFYSHTPNHDITYISPQVKAVLGFTPEEMYVKWTESLSDNPINEIGSRYTQKAIDTGVAQVPFEMELLHKNGTKVWVEVREAPIVENGKTTSIVGALVDITDRKKAEQALVDSESYKNALFHRSSIPMSVMDIETFKFVDCNDAAIKIFAYKSKEEFLGKTPADVSPQKQYNGELSSFAAKDKINSALKDGSVLFEWQHQRPNGDVWDAEVHLMSINYQGKAFLKFSLLDITDRIKAEHALKDSEEKYRLLIENQSDLIVKFDAEGRFLFVSKPFCNLFGKTEQELLGEKLMPFIHEDDRQSAENVMKRLYKPPYKIYYRHRTIINDELRWLSWMDTAVLNDNNRLIEVIAVGRDITDKVKSEQKIIESEQKLRELNAMKDKFFSIIAHDLRSPFNTMLGFSKLLVNKFDSFDLKKQKEFLGILTRDIENTHKLLENLLLWARTQSGNIDFNPEKGNLYLLTGETVDLLRQSAAEKAIIIINEIPEDIYVNADKNMLLTILRNLISNAVKFTQIEGKVFINARFKSDKNYIEISVKDSGVGMANEKQAQLFTIDENISTKGTKGEKGTGLGLILCKEFVERHGGEIWVVSEVGKGSEFVFTLKTD
ncbi:MAG: PAS domain-containing sensor histidine kinase [Bacteroidota bacterium]